LDASPVKPLASTSTAEPTAILLANVAAVGDAEVDIASSEALRPREHTTGGPAFRRVHAGVSGAVRAEESAAN
jgi:hypothetical protein